MPPKFGYWGLQGGGQPCRMLFAYVGVDVEDTIYTMEGTKIIDLIKSLFCQSSRSNQFFIIIKLPDLVSLFNRPL